MYIFYSNNSLVQVAARSEKEARRKLRFSFAMGRCPNNTKLILILNKQLS